MSEKLNLGEWFDIYRLVREEVNCQHRCDNIDLAVNAEKIAGKVATEIEIELKAQCDLLEHQKKGFAKIINGEW